MCTSSDYVPASRCLFASGAQAAEGQEVNSCSHVLWWDDGVMEEAMQQRGLQRAEHGEAPPATSTSCYIVGLLLPVACGKASCSVRRKHRVLGLELSPAARRQLASALLLSGAVCAECTDTLEGVG